MSRSGGTRSPSSRSHTRREQRSVSTPSTGKRRSTRSYSESASRTGGAGAAGMPPPFAPGNTEPVERGGQLFEHAAPQIASDDGNSVGSGAKGEEVHAPLRRLARLGRGRGARPQDDASVAFGRPCPEEPAQEGRERRRLLRLAQFDLRRGLRASCSLEAAQDRVEGFAQVGPVAGRPGEPYPHAPRTHPRRECQDEPDPDRRPVVNPFEDDRAGGGELAGKLSGLLEVRAPAQESAARVDEPSLLEPPARGAEDVRERRDAFPGSCRKRWHEREERVGLEHPARERREKVLRCPGETRLLADARVGRRGGTAGGGGGGGGGRPGGGGGGGV